MLVSQFLFLVAVAATTFPFITDALAASVQPAGRAAGVACKPQERDALLAFKKGITRDPEGRLASWQRGGQGQDCCRWRGVRCSNLTGHVVKLILRNVYTDGHIIGDKFDATALAGKISRSLLTLEYLEHLDLSLNNLAGPSGRIPEFLGSLKHLGYLNLSSIPFFGRVPPQLGNLSKLQYLDLGSYSEMYSTDLSWLTHLPLLRYLNMPSVNLSTVVDWPHVVNMIPSLRVLNLYGCSLTSANQSLPHINLTNLEELNLSFNSFEHPVASCWFWNLTNLKSLVLEATGLYGQLPDALGGMASLQRLSLSESSNISMMTTNLKKLCSLRILELDLFFSYGNIKEIIERLPHCSSNKLQVLHLQGNQLTGALPNWMGHLTSLVILDLSENNITGSLPAFIGHLTSLVILNLSENNITGSLPAFIGHLTSLVILDLSENNITGSLPAFIEHLTSLVILDLSENNITGSLPAFIGLCTSLNTLDLARNHLTGRVPSEISMLTNLTYLDLSDNELDGLITEEHLDGLKSLERVDLSDNSLKIVVGSEWIPHFRLQEAHFASCQMGPLFPAWLKWQVDILFLDISSTGIIDRLPDWFCNVLSKVISLDMSNNQVSGELPANMGIMSLDCLDFSSNNLTGQLPPLPRNLTELDISRNFLSGPLPSNLGAPMLDTLILFSNYITGQIPLSICELSLYALHLANNLFEGELPQCVRTTDMEYLLLSNNSFSGKFPPFLQSCTRLSFLDLASNRFSGTLPMWIGNLVELKFLRLSHNMFHGHIPNNITSLAKLYHLNLAANGISGVIPPHLSNLTAMTKRYIVEPGILPEIQEAVVGELPMVTKRRELNYQGIGILEILSIDLSSNYLAGEIPEEMTSLKGLLNLNLSWNQLSGEVPDNIGDMQSLESLDLSKNNLSGEISSSLSNLTYLSILDLSYNKLTGVIPLGRQLDTIYTENPLMYNGNSGLCGPPLQRKCSGSNASSHGDQKRDEHDSEIMSVYFGLGLGFVFGLWVVFCVLLFKKTWRIAYFRLFDKIYDKVYVFVVVTWGRLSRKATTN